MNYIHHYFYYLERFEVALSPFVLEDDAKTVISKALNSKQIEFKTRYEPRSVGKSPFEIKHQDKFKQDYITIINNNNTLRFIGFNPTNCTHSTFDYYVFDRQEFILNCFQMTKTTNKEKKLTKCIDYFTKTILQKNSLDESFHNLWNSVLIKLEEKKFSSKKLKEKIYMVTEENKVNNYDSYFTGRKETIEKKLRQYFSKKLYEYLLQMNPGFSNILQSVKNLLFENYEDFKTQFSEKLNGDNENNQSKIQFIIEQEEQIKNQITAFITQRGSILDTLINIQTLNIEALGKFCDTEFKN